MGPSVDTIDPSHFELKGSLLLGSGTTASQSAISDEGTCMIREIIIRRCSFLHAQEVS